MKPCRVSAIRMPRSIRTIRFASRRISSTRRGSLSRRTAQERARGEGVASRRGITLPSALETTFCVTTRMSPGRNSSPNDLTASTINAPRSSPWRISGRPVRPMRESSGALSDIEPPVDSEPMEELVGPGLARLIQEQAKILDLVDVEGKVGQLADFVGEISDLGLSLMRPEAVVPETKGARKHRLGTHLAEDGRCLINRLALSDLPGLLDDPGAVLTTQCGSRAV